jgi:plasmid stabilization system protein ParE
MAYRLSRKAEDDIIQIYVTGVAEFGVDQAERYHEGLERILGFLADFPLAAPSAPSAPSWEEDHASIPTRAISSSIGSTVRTSLSSACGTP